jgi:hypothetical protein
VAMWDMNEVVEARWVDGSTLFIRFDDGTAGHVDLSGYRGSGTIFEPLRDLGFFKRFDIEGGALVWPNGADIAPERLYELVNQQNRPFGRGDMAEPKSAVADVHVKNDSDE